MNWNFWMRQTHRWLSIAFTLGFIVNLVVYIVAAGRWTPAFWINLLVLIPIFALFFTGLYLFALPYAGKWRGGRRTALSAHGS